MTAVDTIQQEKGLVLPSSYRDYLKSGATDRFLAEDKEWRLFSAEELVSQVCFSGRDILNYQLIDGHMEDLRQFDKTLVPRGTGGAVTIGEENTDLLFFNQQLNVCAFFASSLEVLKISDSFDDFLKLKCAPEAVVESSCTPNLEGLWIPESSTTHKDSFVKMIYPSFRFHTDGTGLRKDAPMEWKVVEDGEDDRACIQINSEDRFYLSELTEDSFVYSNRDNDLRITYRKVES